MKSVTNDKARAFAKDVTAYCKYLNKTYHDYNLADQLYRSATSIYANLGEMAHSESTSDFSHKLSIALKEANESLQWLKHAQDIGHMPDTYRFLFRDCAMIIKLLYKALETIRHKRI